MKSSLRVSATVLMLGSLALFAACKPGAKPADKADKPATEAKGDTAVTIAGLPTEKDQVSYMIGMDLAKSFEPIKDQIDVDTIAKTAKDILAGGKPLMDDTQAQAVREAFGQKMQAQQIAKMMADAKKNLTEGQAFLAANGKKPGITTTASGVQYQVITEGKGPKPKADDLVRVNYKGSLLDGKVFDTTETRGEPAVVALGQVVPGWREAVMLMPVGSKYRFWIPADQGYGDKVPPGAPIGPNAVLQFEVELLDIEKAAAK